MVKDSRLFTNPKNISRYLNCIICEEVFNDPARLPCGHTFCRECIDTWTKQTRQCPVCRAKFTVSKLSRDMVAANIIEELEVMCKHRGCQWRGELGNVEVHEHGCKFHPDKVESWLIESLPCKTYDDEEGVSISGGTLISSLYERFGSALNVIRGKRSEESLAKPKMMFFDDLSDQENLY
jgi:hypothetical protein